ncbi:MAG: prepilin-type N-terminal cleavage/methylation domain-containing protein [Patescibacteria group bacterium]|nr:MAG: prepilin-type N-terminal cleavage/methylation domain-containing protein [Patescibacteria group bacterium]
MKLKNNKKGFTLIEMLVTIGIISIIATIAIVNYNNAILRSRDERRKVDLEAIRSALEMYRVNNDYYPTNIYTLTTPNPSPYIGAIPTDPKSTQYKYVYQPVSCTGSQCSDYTLGTIQEILNSSCSVILNCSSTGTTINCKYCLGPNGKK